MSSLNVARETKKKQTAQRQIDINLATKPTEIKVCGRKALQTIISPMEPYSTKFMSPDDQFVLAVDRVDSPEVKNALMPEFIPTDDFIDPKAKTGYDYAAHLSLNFGDKDSLHTLEAKTASAALRCYMFGDGKSGERTEKEKSEYENMSDEEIIEGIVKSAYYGKNITEKDLGNIDFVLEYKYESDYELKFVFDLYDGGEMSGNPKIPSISASFVVVNEYDQYTNEQKKWEYVITLHVDENKKPKDAVIKQSYLKLQRFMRAIIVTMGILPSKL